MKPTNIGMDLHQRLMTNMKKLKLYKVHIAMRTKNAGLKFGNYVFALGTSKDKILKACSDAEFAILTSSRKFNGKYTYEIKYAGHSIYSKNFGTR